METRWAKKFRAITLALIFSGALNIALLGTLIFLSIEEKGKTFFPKETVHVKETGNLEHLAAMSKLKFRELVSFLTNRDLVEEGYLKRDLALAALVAFCDFNLEKALCGSIPQRRTVTLSSQQQIEIFPGLTDEQFQAILKFAYEEKWPLTSKGLFRLLKKWTKPRDESLVQAFIVTPEFHALQAFFQKSGFPQEPSVLVDLICEGNWDLLDRFSREQQMLDFSDEKRQRLLLDYLALQSPTAAHLLLCTDFSFALKKLSDSGAMELLNNLDQTSLEAKRYCAELLRSPRADVVLHLAAQKLYSFLGETPPEPFDLKEVLARFDAAAPQETPRGALPSYRFHVVKEGETLWKIARQYRISLNELIRLNELEKDQIFPGMTLRISQN